MFTSVVQQSRFLFFLSLELEWVPKFNRLSTFARMDTKVIALNHIFVAFEVVYPYTQKFAWVQFYQTLNKYFE